MKKQYQTLEIGDKEYILGAVDIGNSRIKISISGSFAAFQYKPGWENQVKDSLKDVFDKPLLIGYSEVSRRLFGDFKKMIKTGRNVKLVNSLDLLKKQNEIDFSLIKGAGPDRMLGMIGAKQNFKPPFITVDCGTALTVNVVDKNSVCVGGAILAGIYTQMKALTDSAYYIKPVTFAQSELPIGRNTADAINSGILHGSAEAVKGIVEVAAKKVLRRKTLPVALTGGYVDLILPPILEWNFPVYINKKLVLDGIIHLLKCVKFHNFS